MGLVEAIVLGLIQGLTEFLPISSSAHLRIAAIFLTGGRDPGAAFTAIVQLGTELAVLVAFRRDIARIVRAFLLGVTKRAGPDGQPLVPRTDHDYRMGWLIIVGSLPIVILGVVLRDVIETSFRSLWIVATTLIVFGILLGVADRLGRKRLTLDRLTTRDGLIFGLAQALALVPGVSRSGGTIAAGLVLGYTRAAAARYSFLLALPAVFGSGLFELVRTVRDPRPEVFGGLETLLATAVAFGVGLLVIAVFLRYLDRGSFLPFVAYRILLGVALYGLLLAGLAQP